MATETRSAAQDAPDRCPRDGTPHEQVVPAKPIGHLAVFHGDVVAELVASVCPGCGDILVMLVMEQEPTDPEGEPLGIDRSGWASLTDVSKGTRDLLARVNAAAR